MVRSDVEYTLQEDEPAAAPLAFKAFLFRIGVVIALMYAGAKLASVATSVDAQGNVLQGNVLMESSTSNVSDSICVRLPIRSDDCLPAVAKGATAGFLTGLFLVPTFFIALCICGFGLCGIIKGSCAAACQTPSTDAGSCFACCQSCGMTAAKAIPVALILAVLGSIVAAAVSSYLTSRNSPTGPSKCRVPTPAASPAGRLRV
eukprot:5282432-Prymnesium_polylepis.1